MVREQTVSVPGSSRGSEGKRGQAGSLLEEEDGQSLPNSAVGILRLPDEIQEGRSSQEWCPGGACTLRQSSREARLSEARPLAYPALEGRRPYSNVGALPGEAVPGPRQLGGWNTWHAGHLPILEGLQSV